MQTLADTLCKELDKDELKLNSKVLSLSYGVDAKSDIGNWTVSSAAKSDKQSKGLSVDAIIMTVSWIICSIKRLFNLHYYFSVYILVLNKHAWFHIWMTGCYATCLVEFIFEALSHCTSICSAHAPTLYTYSSLILQHCSLMVTLWRKIM